MSQTSYASFVGLKDANGTFTARPKYGPLLFFEHLGQPTLEQRLREYCQLYGIDYDTFNFRDMIGTTDEQILTRPMNLSAQDVYIAAHTVRIPPSVTSVSPELATATGLFYNVLPDAEMHPYMDIAYETKRIVSRPPALVPAGFTSITLISPVYFRSWSAFDIANRTSYRGHLLMVLWNETFLDTLDHDEDITWELVDVEADSRFVGTLGYRHRSTAADLDPSLVHSSLFTFFEREYRLTIYPTSSLINSEVSSIPAIVLAVFLGAAVLFGIVVFWIALINQRHQVSRAQLLAVSVFLLLIPAAHLSLGSFFQEHNRATLKSSVNKAEVEAHARVLGYVHHEVRNVRLLHMPIDARCAHMLLLRRLSPLMSLLQQQNC